MINNTVYSNAGVNRDLQRPCVISQVTGLAVSYAGSVGIAISAGTESATSGTVVMSNGGGVAFGMSASTITALHSGNVSATGNTLATNSVSMTIGSAIVFAGSGGASIGVSNGSVVISGATGGGGGGGGVALSAGTNSTGTGTVVFSNANGVSFGMNTNAAITASTGLPINVDGDAATVTQLIFTASNGITFGLDGASITASHNALTSQSNQALSGSNGSFTFQTATFGNLNGMSFYTSNGSLVGSYTVPTVTNSAMTVSDAATSGTLARLAFTNLNGVTLSLSTGAAGSHTIVGSHNALTSQSNQAFSAGAASSTFQTLSFQDSNGVSFSNNAGAVRVTHALQFTSATSAITSNALHTSSPRVNVSAGTTSNNLSAITFANANGVTFGLNASTVTASHNGITSQTAQTIGLYAVSNTTGQSSSTTVDARTLSFHGAGIASVGYSGGSVVISVPSGGGAGDGYNILAAGTQTAATTGTVVLSNSNGISFGMSNSSIVTASISQATLSNSNNVSFGLNAGVITATATWPSLVASFGTSNTSGSTQTLSSGSLVFAAGSNITLSGSTAAGAQTITIHGASGGAGGGVAIAAGGATATSGTVVFSNSNGVSFGLDGSVVTATAYIGVRAISANGGEVSSGTVEFVNSNGVSFDINAGSVVASVVPPTTHSLYAPHQDRLLVVGQQGQGTLHLWPYSFPDLSIDRVGLVVHNTNSSNSSGSHTLSFWFGLYTRSNSSLSLLASASNTTAITHSGTAGSYSLFSGNRLFTLGLSTLLPANDYWVGIISRTTSAGTNGTYSQVLVSAMASNFLGHFGSSHNTTYQSGLGAGVYTATTSAFPGSIAFTQIRGSDSLAMRSPVWMLQNGTV